MMNIVEAKEALSYHSLRNADIDHPKWEHGFLGSLRPYQGELYEENFIEVMECLRVLQHEFMTPMIDHDLIADFVSIVHSTRAWLAPMGMLGSNELLTKADTERLLTWVEIIETCVMYLLDGMQEEAFWDYDEYRKERCG